MRGRHVLLPSAEAGCATSSGACAARKRKERKEKRLWGRREGYRGERQRRGVEREREAGGKWRGRESQAGGKRRGRGREGKCRGGGEAGRKRVRVNVSPMTSTTEGPS